jgi:hypothetical protein
MYMPAEATPSGNSCVSARPATSLVPSAAVPNAHPLSKGDAEQELDLITPALSSVGNNETCSPWRAKVSLYLRDSDRFQDATL